MISLTNTRTVSTNASTQNIQDNASLSMRKWNTKNPIQNIKTDGTTGKISPAKPIINDAAMMTHQRISIKCLLYHFFVMLIVYLLSHIQQDTCSKKRPDSFYRTFMMRLRKYGP